jgi:hypothetical protein
MPSLIWYQLDSEADIAEVEKSCAYLTTTIEISGLAFSAFSPLSSSVVEAAKGGRSYSCSTENDLPYFLPQRGLLTRFQQFGSCFKEERLTIPNRIPHCGIFLASASPVLACHLERKA